MDPKQSATQPPPQRIRRCAICGQTQTRRRVDTPWRVVTHAQPVRNKPHTHTWR